MERISEQIKKCQLVPVATSVFLLTQKIEAERAFEPTLKSLWVTS